MVSRPPVTDWLALERTELANERTLLAWSRTGLGFLLAAATLLRFGDGHPADLVAAGAAVVLGAAAGAVGLLRYRAASKRYAVWRDALRPRQGPDDAG